MCPKPYVTKITTFRRVEDANIAADALQKRHSGNLYYGVVMARGTKLFVRHTGPRIDPRLRAEIEAFIAGYLLGRKSP